MPVNQRDVFMYTHPDIGPDKDHPFIVLSVFDANNQEKTFVGVMITSSEVKKDEYSFSLQDGMFDKPLKKDNCHVRMHLIITALDEKKGQKVNTMKKFYFDELMKAIGDLVFDYNFLPL